MSAGPSRGKWVIGFIIRLVLFYFAISWATHYAKQFDFSELTMLGLVMVAIAVAVLVSDLILKRLGLNP